MFDGFQKIFKNFNNKAHQKLPEVLIIFSSLNSLMSDRVFVTGKNVGRVNGPNNYLLRMGFHKSIDSESFTALLNYRIEKIGIEATGGSSFQRLELLLRTNKFSLVFPNENRWAIEVMTMDDELVIDKCPLKERKIWKEGYLKGVKSKPCGNAGHPSPSTK